MKTGFAKFSVFVFKYGVLKFLSYENKNREPMKGCLQFLKIEFDGIFVIKFNRVGPNAMSSRFLSLPYKPS